MPRINELKRIIPVLLLFVCGFVCIFTLVHWSESDAQIWQKLLFFLSGPGSLIASIGIIICGWTGALYAYCFVLLMFAGKMLPSLIPMPTFLAKILPVVFLCPLCVAILNHIKTFIKYLRSGEEDDVVKLPAHAVAVRSVWSDRCYQLVYHQNSVIAYYIDSPANCFDPGQELRKVEKKDKVFPIDEDLKVKYRYRYYNKNEEIILKLKYKSAAITVGAEYPSTDKKLRSFCRKYLR